MKFRVAYEEYDRVQSHPKGESRTKQSMSKECDINFIMDKYRRTGVIEHLNRYDGEYGDFAAFDFHEAMNIVAEAKEMFMSVPAQIRSKFANDPALFIDYVTDENNLAEMREMGLARPERPDAGSVENPQRRAGDSSVLDVTVPTDSD